MVNAVFVSPGEGEELSAGSVLKAARPEFTVVESAYPRGPGSEPHVHRAHADAFYVLDGELDFAVADERVPLAAGAFVLAPAGVVHSFSVATDRARWLNLHAPDGGFAESRRARRDGRDPREPLDAFSPPDDVRPAPAAVVRRPGEGTRGSSISQIKVGCDEIVVTESAMPAGGRGPTPHVHERHSDSFYVLAGELEFLLGDEIVRAPAGAFALAPPETVHTFWNPGQAIARYLNFHTPGARFDQYLVERERRGDVDLAFLAEFDIHDVDVPHPAEV